MSWWIDGIEWGRAGQWDKPASLGAHRCVHRCGGWAHECFWCMCECVQVGADGCWSESPSITLPPYSLLLYLSVKLRASLSDVCQLALGISLSLLAEAGITCGLPAHPASGWGGFPGILTPVIKFAHQVPWPLDIFPGLVMAFWHGFWKMKLQSFCQQAISGYPHRFVLLLYGTGFPKPLGRRGCCSTSDSQSPFEVYKKQDRWGLQEISQWLKFWGAQFPALLLW